MGKALALMLVLLAVGTVLLFVGQDTWWFPQNHSVHGSAIDAQFMRTLVVVGIAFVGAQVALGYAVFRFGRKGDARAVYSHGSTRLEITWTLITAAIFIAIAVLGQRVWAQLHLNDAPADSVKVSVVGQQFQWNFHYPGADNEFGKTDPKFYDDSTLNFVGVDPSDAKGRDDVQATTLLIPVNRPVELTLRSKDVIHSLFIPHMRIKQDAVPGLAIRVHFTPTQVGRYEIPCAELCGNNHFNMKSFLLVLTEEEYSDLATKPDEEFKTRLGELLQQYK
ncbi:MAG TPA: cytochrome c oxidase subunit II [Blastocatellia bacterium]|nr:cytochrome c oxidase subunit II [Blastocatellia bacterium]